MESTLKQAIVHSNSTNAIGHVNLVSNLFRETERELQQYHHLIQLFRQELDSMRSKIENNNNEIQDITRPLVDSLYQTLQLGMVNQKQENGSFQEQINQLKKEKSIINQMIAATLKRNEQLSHEVGYY